MEAEAVHVELLKLAARKLRGHERRAFVAEVVVRLCGGKERLAEDRFGWNRHTVRKGLQERQTGEIIPGNYENTGRRRFEELHPQFATDVREISEPKTHTDPELKSDRRYLNLTSAEVRAQLIEKGWTDEELPAGRTMRRVLNRMGYRLKRVQKGKPLKKTEHTDAIFENVQSMR